MWNHVSAYFSQGQVDALYNTYNITSYDAPCTYKQKMWAAFSISLGIQAKLLSPGSRSI